MLMFLAGTLGLCLVHVRESCLEEVMSKLRVNVRSEGTGYEMDHLSI